MTPLHMAFDLKVPNTLKNTQSWFGAIISQPLGPASSIQPMTPSGNPIEEEAQKYIAASPTLRPDQRIQIYNQQYWWRLLDTMHDLYPLVTRLFGYEDFNHSIAVPFLVRYPPRHWSLNLLADRLPAWIEEFYTAPDKRLVVDSAWIDLAYTLGFVAEEYPLLQETVDIPPEELSQHILNQPLRFQPHVRLFALSYDLFQARSAFLAQEPEYWIDNNFPQIPQAPEGELFHFMLFRDVYNNMSLDRISSSQYHILSHFVNGARVDAICEWLEEQDMESVLYKEASEKLHLWLQRWTALRLLYTLT